MTILHKALVSDVLAMNQLTTKVKSQIHIYNSFEVRPAALLRMEKSSLVFSP